MTFTAHKSKVRTIRQGEADFTLVDGIVVYPRAMLHISPECPASTRDTINWAISQGYLKSVAHTYDHELMWDHLNN